jgi:hypothetical protein
MRGNNYSGVLYRKPKFTRFGCIFIGSNSMSQPVKSPNKTFDYLSVDSFPNFQLLKLQPATRNHSIKLISFQAIGALPRRALEHARDSCLCCILCLYAARCRIGCSNLVNYRVKGSPIGVPYQKPHL